MLLPEVRRLSRLAVAVAAGLEPVLVSWQRQLNALQPDAAMAWLTANHSLRYNDHTKHIHITHRRVRSLACIYYPYIRITTSIHYPYVRITSMPLLTRLAVAAAAGLEPLLGTWQRQLNAVQRTSAG